MQKPTKYAVIKTGGKQYLVHEGREFAVEKLSDDEENTDIIFDEVLLAVDGDKVEVGQPYLKNIVVKAQKLEQIKGPKIRGFKYTTGTQYRRRFGHRQKLTRVRIESLGF
ncbi:50S ribosomal protein L21 [Patescibacteria group bacterium]|nr:50S ribosomal protein L21 [Patescibacteria group bacterium]